MIRTSTVRPRRARWRARAGSAALLGGLTMLLLSPLTSTAAAGQVVSATMVSGADWSQYRNGPAHLGLNALETVLSPSTVTGLRQAWAITPGSTGDRVTDPAVVDGVAYVGSSNGKVYALNAATGGILWTVTTGGRVQSSPAVVDGVVYAGSADGKVYALNAATGAILWSVTTGGQVLDAPAVTGGMVYVRAQDGNAYALDAATGATVWTASIGGTAMFCSPPGPSSPAVADGMVYVAGTCLGRLYALDAATGAAVWTVPAYIVGGTPAVAGGVVYALIIRGLGAGDLYALDADTGAIVWSVPGTSISSPSSVSPVVANGVLYTGTSTGVLVARDPATGASLWSDSGASGVNRNGYTSLVVANGAVYAGRGAAVSAHHL